MDLLKSNQTVEIVMENLFDIVDYSDDDVEFIITRENDEDVKTIVGVECNMGKIVYTTPNHSIIEYTDITIKREYNKFLSNGIEPFILLKLMEGYEIEYMSLQMHCILWKYIETLLSESNILEKGIHSYLSYCVENGINALVLSYYNKQEIQDLIDIFITSRFDGYDVVLYENIGDKKLIMGIQHHIYFNTGDKEATESIKYRVTVFHVSTGKVEYNDYHQNIDQAFADYRNHFFGLSYSYYLEREDEDNYLVKELKELVFENMLENNELYKNRK